MLFRKGDTSMERKGIQIICKSFFKSGEDISISIFTKKWIETINYLEKMKNNTVPKA